MDEYSFKTKDSRNEDDVISFYDNYAENWDNRFNNNKSTDLFMRNRLNSFINALNECGTLDCDAIELGVGTGVYIKETAKIFKSIIAVDGSKKMLSFLEDKTRAYSLKNVKILCSNVTDLKAINDNSVDITYFFGLIEHVINIDMFIGEISRILKPGGYVIGVTPNGKSPWYSVRSFLRKTGKHCSSDRYYTEKCINELLVKHNFIKKYIEYWGTFPADVPSWISRTLFMIEPYIKKSFLRYCLGGITFAYKNNKL